MEPEPHEPSPDASETQSGRAILAELALALAIAVLGAVVIWQTTHIRLTPINSRVGPRVIPYLVGAGLVFTGLWYALDVIRGRGTAPSEIEDQEDIDPSLPTDWTAIGLISISLLAYLMLIERAGYIIASAALFFGAAFAMGSRQYVRDIAAGIALAVVTYVIFTKGLSLRLPAGALPSIGEG